MSALCSSLSMIIVIHVVQTFLLSHSLTPSCFLGQINILMKGVIFLHYCLSTFYNPAHQLTCHNNDIVITTLLFHSQVYVCSWPRRFGCFFKIISCGCFGQAFRDLFELITAEAIPQIVTLSSLCVGSDGGDGKLVLNNLWRCPGSNQGIGSLMSSGSSSMTGGGITGSVRGSRTIMSAGSFL